MTNLDLEPIVIKKIYQFYLSIFGQLNNFPKRSRYTLGEKIENVVLEIIELINLANIQIKNLREPFLYKASAKCGVLKLLIRLSWDLNLLNHRQYLILEGQLQEISKMIGGWIKYCRTQ